MLKRWSLYIALLLLCTCVFAEQSIKWITIDDIKKSLEGKEAMNVGFDIDDTVLFSSAGFYYGKLKYSPGSYKFLGMYEFWHELNNGLDKYSIPKKCAIELIAFHQQRGDSIYFITARTETKTEKVTEILAKTFHIKNPNKVIFTGHSKEKNLKIEPIKKNNIKIYYGDSDSDIVAAQKAGVRGIRIIRARNSTHKPMPIHGALGEEVIFDSDH